MKMGIDQLETDEQRAELFVEWLKENAISLILLFLALFSFLGGWQYYKHSQYSGKIDQAELFATFTAKYKAGEDFNGILEELSKSSYSSYYSLASMDAAHYHLTKNKLPQAEAILAKALAKEEDAVLKSLLTYYLATVYFEDKAFAKASEQLESITLQGFRSIAKQLQGDILIVQGNVDGARMAYQQAIQASSEPSQNLIGKLNALGVSEPNKIN